MTYVDGFVLVVKKKNLKKYKAMAKKAARMWKKHGALGYFECMGDDLNPNMNGMKQKTFPKLAGAKPSETVWFSFIMYKSKQHRNSVNKKVMSDPAMKEECSNQSMPFDMKQFSWGGFKAVIEEKRRTL